MNPQPTAKTLVEFFEGHPERLTKEYYAELEDGRICEASDSGAVRWCVIGAAQLLGLNYLPLNKYTSCDSVCKYVRHHTFHEIIDLLKRAGV